MRRLTLLTALAAAAAALVGVPSAGAKFSISLRVEPAQPWAKQPVRVIARTGIELPKDHGLQLHVVGPGRAGRLRHRRLLPPPPADRPQGIQGNRSLPARGSVATDRPELEWSDGEGAAQLVNVPA